MSEYFKNKVAVVTGAAGIICSEVSKELAAQGVTLALVDRAADRVQQVAETIRANGGTCECFSCDVTDKAVVDAVAAQIVERFGRVDFLVNGAGGNQAPATPNIPKFDPAELEDVQPEGLRGLYNVDFAAFESVLKVNTMGTFYPTLAFAKYMIRQGGGAVVNFASMNAYCPLTRNFSYAMAKAAIANLTQSMAAYFGETGIRINAVAPGFVINDRSRLILGSVEDGLTERGSKVIAHTPMSKFGTAMDMCGCVKFLLDETASGFITGITVPVDGGFLTLSGV
ncbi:MAG: SDR family NAD(P)-dependent oxidoreductase [Clostridia bacterium]|nr:SDR family NAD(P)-dependent oxidoreductase [Clostridia bacterium]